MATFAQMQSDLTLLGMGNLIQTDVGALLNKCNREEVEAWDWSFLYQNVVIWGVAPYQTGTMTLATGSNIVTGTGTVWTPNMAGWFLGVGATLTTPVLVSAFVTAQALQLSAPWAGPNLVNAPYSLFPLYYDVFPLRTVFRVRQIDFLTQTSQEALNRIDPSRVSTGGNPSLRWADGVWTSDSPPHFQIELWPRPSSPLPYICDGKAGSSDMLNPNDQPQVPSAVIEAKASMYLARSVFASTGNPKWFQLVGDYKDDYIRERDAARVEDNRRKVTLGITATGVRGGVNLGLDYYSIHDAAGPPYMGGAE